jgi:hypothetical protein
MHDPQQVLNHFLLGGELLVAQNQLSRCRAQRGTCRTTGSQSARAGPCVR